MADPPPDPHPDLQQPPDPDPTASYGARLSADRPTGLRLTTLRRSWFRIDAQPPSQWDWRPFPHPMGRFDSAAGRRRVRYAADSQRGAMRERFDGVGRVVAADQLDHHLIEISGAVRILDLRKDRTLDALGLDDQISTSRAPGPWRACQRLTDLVDSWFGDAITGLVYRSRTTPERGANLVWWHPEGLTVTDRGSLRANRALLVACALGDGFAFEGW